MRERRDKKRRESWSFRFRRRMGMRILKPRWRRCMIRRVRIYIWRGGFFSSLGFWFLVFGFLRFSGPFSSCFFLVSFFSSLVFFVPFSSRLCLFLPGGLALLTLSFCLITFSFLGSWVFCGLFCSCFFLSVVLFMLFSFVRFLCVGFFVPLFRPFCFVSLHRSFYSPVFSPSLSLPSQSSRLANVILRFRLPLSIDEPVCLPP